MSANHQESAKVRIGQSLNKKEEDFVARRRSDVQQRLNELKISCSENEVPNIALLGSGGGERAMVGLLGSLDQLQKTGLLDCILYLSGVSGSTWCMASLYKEPDWSTQLGTVKDKIIQRLNGPEVSWTKASAKLEKYYQEKDIFSLTDVWAAMVVTDFVKEIDEHTLTDHWKQKNNDPFPIYTTIDNQCKDADPWFEFTPHEAGYSVSGAFVETSSFGSQFQTGTKIKHQPEMDMLYLQALCGSALADGETILKLLWGKIKEFFQHVRLSKPEMKTEFFPHLHLSKPEMKTEDLECPNEVYQVLIDLVDMNLSVLNGIDPFDLDKSIRKNLNELSGGKHQLICLTDLLNLTDKESAKCYMEQYNVDVCNALSLLFNVWPFEILKKICVCMAQWIWGRNYDFLQDMKDKAIPPTLLKSETRDYIDAGLLLNSPYISVLRKERHINLIISLDFSDDDPFATVKEAAEMCRKLHIPFPEVKIPDKDRKNPQDFYVFKGKDAPTVIHIPLFNVVNCGDKIEDWREKYATIQFPYRSSQMINDLMDVAGKNITNNEENLKKQIRLAITKHK